MAAIVPEINDLINEAKITFKTTFSENPEIATCAPGRVNLIGEHTDYNDGFVFPMALPLVSVIVGKKQPHTRQCRIKTLATSADQPLLVEFSLPSPDTPLKPSTPAWANYMKGVIANFPGSLVGFDAVVISSVPLGGGLSSSASLEVATYTFLECLSGHKASSLQAKALVCQKAEHDFADMPCGIMDQFISTMGEEGAALLIDCRSMESKLVLLDDQSVVFVIINSNVRHSLTGSEYPSRRKNCHDAAALMGIPSLREGSMDILLKHKDKMSEEMYHQVRHVITEIDRTTQAVACLKERNYKKFGELMTASHMSLRDDYKVSCVELDELVTLALAAEGVYGSRMTGGGFGGCTVTLVSKESVDKLISHVNASYSGKATFYVCKPSKGAQILSI